MSSITEVSEGDMKVWVMNELYSELIAMPLWVSCAFDRDGEFVFEKSQQRLAAYLIGKQMGRCPPYAYNRYYHENATVESYRGLFRQAWLKSKS